MSTPGRILVVGASAAGLATVESLRRKGYEGAVTLLGAEPHLPYDRPPLSKQVLAGDWQPEQASLRPHEALDALDAEFVLGEPATALDVTTRTVRTAGRAFSADAIVIATGTRPRTLPAQAGLAGIHVLRTLDDTVALQTELLASSRLVVVGDGVLGAEIAATAHTMGLQVTVVGPQQTPMSRQLGSVVGELLGALHAERGVGLRLGTGVTGFESQDGRVTGVCLDTGEVLPTDVVVVAIGAVPVTDWLEGSGLRVENGLVCDAGCRAADGIYAAGDVARWHHERLDALLRLENRTNAIEQAGVVAANLLGEDLVYTPVPYFWTDQFDAKIQVHGMLPAGADMTIVDGDPQTRRFVARYSLGGRVTGIVGWNMPKQTRLRRQEVVDALTSPRPGPTPALG